MGMLEIKFIPSLLFFIAVSFGITSVDSYADVVYSGCFDVFGNAVPTIVNVASPWLARAQTVGDAKSVIVINPKLMKPFTRTTQRVIYWHECGHIALAHMLKGNPITMIQEQEADCYGIRSAITLGDVKLGDVAKVQSDFASLGPGDWQHFSGASRSVNLKSCLNDGLTEAAWSNCKKRFYGNADVIQKSVGALKQMKAICNKFKSGSSECGDARKLANELHNGVIAEIRNLDKECPYISDPKFTKWIHAHQEAMMQLKIQKLTK